jgi:hypothetical protein
MTVVSPIYLFDRADIHQALLSLACSVICFRQLILN